MSWTTIIWNNDPADGNVEHIAQHGLTIEDVEHILSTFDAMDDDRGDERLTVWDSWKTDGDARWSWK
jgi:hypothetical protein